LNETRQNWFARRVKKEVEKDVMPFSERVGNAVAIVAIILATLYFVAHQTWSTGFFTSRFGFAEALLLYSSLLYGLIPTSVKGLVGRRNLARIFEVFGSILTTIALVWLYVVFPFDFSHFADVLPTFARFLLQWLSNDIARLLMIMGIIMMPISAAYNMVLYIFVRKEISKNF